MSYTKQTWAVGDKITSSKLNHMEDGIAAANTAIPLIVTEEEGFTYNELLAAVNANQPVYLKSTYTQEDEFKIIREWELFLLTYLSDDHEFEDENTTVVSCYADFNAGSVVNHVEFRANDMDETMTRDIPNPAN